MMTATKPLPIEWVLNRDAVTVLVVYEMLLLQQKAISIGAHLIMA